MSRESYIRGFCKKAEAAGVDPVALAKYAQEFKTDGFVSTKSASFGKTKQGEKMSKQSYIDGFCKKAAENGLDPKALAQFAVQKEAQDAAAAASGSGGNSELWAKVKEFLEKAKAKTINAAESAARWYGKRNHAEKALIGAGLGSAVGTGLGAALAGKKGLRAGAVLGAVGGGAAAVDWNALAESFKRLQKEDNGGNVAKTDPAAAAAASDAAKAAVTGSK